MKNKIYFYGFAILVSASYANEGYCPKMCECDVYKDMNRAICSGQRLINAQIDMPKEVEILDLSKNDIDHLDEDSFKNLKNLRHLVLSNNSIHTIHYEAFEHLKKLEYLDMSNNRLSVFDEKILENNNNLQTINLSGNKFMNLGDESLLKSHSIENINLSNSQLSQINSVLLKNLPQLKVIDLSNNLLITLDKDMLKHNKKLRKIILHHNPWNCDSNLKSTLKWLQWRHVDINIIECGIPKTKPMFERMQMESTMATTKLPKQREITVDIDSVWTMNKKDLTCPEDDGTKACDMFEDCLNDRTQILREMQWKMENLNKYKKKQRERFREAEFYVGLFTGTIFGAIIVYLCTLCCGARRKLRKRSRTTSPQRIDIDANPLYPQITTISETAVNVACNQPMRRNQRRPARNQQQQQQQQQPSFWTRLFQRPAHRRYTTTNLVRRLSQSRLFLNVSRLNTDSGRDEQHQNSTSDVTRLIDNASDTNLNYRINDEQHDREMIIPSAPSSDDVVQPPRRPETPPPAYKDIVQSNHLG